MTLYRLSALIAGGLLALAQGSAMALWKMPFDTDEPTLYAPYQYEWFRQYPPYGYRPANQDGRKIVAPSLTKRGVHTINIGNREFEKPELSIDAGDTVVWVNRDNTAHKISTVNEGGVTGFLDHGQMIQKTFTQAGTYAYYCEYHPAMRGVVIVEQPG